MQAGSLLLLAISLLFDNNLVESSFANLVTGLTITAIVGIVLFWKEIVAGFDYFKEETLWRIFSIFLWVGLIFSRCYYSKIMSNNLIANQQDVLSFGAQVPLLVTLFFLAIVGPIAEELVFRQVLMNCLSETIGIACATMISIFIHLYAHTTAP